MEAPIFGARNLEEFLAVLSMDIPTGIEERVVVIHDPALTPHNLSPHLESRYAVKWCTFDRANPGRPWEFGLVEKTPEEIKVAGPCTCDTPYCTLWRAWDRHVGGIETNKDKIKMAERSCEVHIFTYK